MCTKDIYNKVTVKNVRLLIVCLGPELFRIMLCPLLIVTTEIPCICYAGVLPNVRAALVRLEAKNGFVSFFWCNATSGIPSHQTFGVKIPTVEQIEVRKLGEIGQQFGEGKIWATVTGVAALHLMSVSVTVQTT